MQTPRPAGGLQEPPGASGLKEPPGIGGLQEPPAAGGLSEPPGSGSLKEPPGAAGLQEPPGATPDAVKGGDAGGLQSLGGPSEAQYVAAIPDSFYTSFWLTCAVTLLLLACLLLAPALRAQEDESTESQANDAQQGTDAGAVAPAATPQRPPPLRSGAAPDGAGAASHRLVAPDQLPVEVLWLGADPLRLRNLCLHRGGTTGDQPAAGCRRHHDIGDQTKR